MNDSVESFLVFHDFKMTGMFDMDYDGSLDADMQELEQGFLLVVRQGEKNTFTIQFTKLSLEVHLYNYGEIGHFWMEGQEDIRQLEYRLSIMRDKYYYLGESYINEKERVLLPLADFPPVMNQYAVPLKYMKLPDEPWFVTESAIETMENICREAGDKKLCRMLQFYRKHPGILTGKFLFRELGKPQYTKVICLIAKRIKEAALQYPNRKFVEVDQQYSKLWKEVCKTAAEKRKKGEIIEALREEPFVEAPDDLEFKVYLMEITKEKNKKKINVIRQSKEKYKCQT